MRALTCMRIRIHVRHATRVRRMSDTSLPWSQIRRDELSGGNAFLKKSARACVSREGRDEFASLQIH